MRARQAGFTIIEIMVALAIMAGMMTLIWGSFSLTIRSKERVEVIEARYHQIRLGMNRMARELSMAFLSKNNPLNQNQQEPRTQFIGQRNSSVDDLMFSSLAHVPLVEDAKECDQTMIRYYAAPDPEDRKVTNLMRRASRRLGSDKPGEDGPAYVMIEDIEKLHFEYADESALTEGKDKKWVDTWSTKSATGQPDRLPIKVRISLTVKNEAGDETTYVTATRIQMRDALWFSSGS